MLHDNKQFTKIAYPTKNRFQVADYSDGCDSGAYHWRFGPRSYISTVFVRPL